MTKPRFARRLGFAAIMAVASRRAFRAGAAGRAGAAEGRQADQCRRRAVGGTQCHEGRGGKRGKGVATYQLTSEPRRLPPPNGLCNLETGPETFQLITTSDAQAAQLKGFIGKEISVKVDEVACAQDAGQMSEAVITKWSVVTSIDAIPLPRARLSSYAAASQFNSRRLGNTESPGQAG